MASQPYDQSAVTWSRFTMSVRPTPPKPYDANWEKSTMTKKFVTTEAVEIGSKPSLVIHRGRTQLRLRRHLEPPAIPKARFQTQSSLVPWLPQLSSARCLQPPFHHA